MVMITVFVTIACLALSITLLFFKRPAYALAATFLGIMIGISALNDVNYAIGELIPQLYTNITVTETITVTTTIVSGNNTNTTTTTTTSTYVTAQLNTNDIRYLSLMNTFNYVYYAVVIQIIVFMATIAWIGYRRLTSTYRRVIGYDV